MSASIMRAHVKPFFDMRDQYISFSLVREEALIVIKISSLLIIGLIGLHSSTFLLT